MVKPATDIIGIGTAVVDYFFQTDEEFLKRYNLKPEDDFLFQEKKISPNLIFKKLKPITKSPGGIAVNTIATLAKLGINVGYYGVIGNDDNSDFWLEILPELVAFGSNRMAFCSQRRLQGNEQETYPGE